MPLRTVNATRYITPLREGGSLPAIMEGDDAGLYVLKFRGAGQGPKALIAELVAGELARALGLPVPEIVFMQLEPELARTEPDPEIQDLMRASAGALGSSESLNLALDYLPGSVTFDPLALPPGMQLDADLASRIVWFDAFVTNIDRTPRNSNMLTWHRQLWLIDHGAALFFHHQWDGFLQRALSPFEPIKDHVLLPFIHGSAERFADVDDAMASRLTPSTIQSVVEQIPDSWLADDPMFSGPDAQRRAYVDYFVRRLQPPRAFALEAIRARAAHV